MFESEPNTSPWVYADTVHLLYGGDFIGPTVGYAGLGTLCRKNAAGVNQVC